MRTRQAVLALMAFTLAACAASSARVADGQVATARSEHGLLLTATLGRSVVAPMAPIPYTSSLEYLGPDGAFPFDASGWGPVLHTVRRLDNELDQHVTWNLDCSRFELRKGDPAEQPLRKSGSWDRGTPEGDFWVTFFDDPELRLPAGQWAIDAVARYYPEPGCGGTETWLQATVMVTVGGQPAAAPTRTPGPSSP